jgi:predicted RNA-binding Zn ribbon-like protein
VSTDYPAAEPLAVELMNTVRIDSGEVCDELGTDDQAAAWLTAMRDRIEPAAGKVVDGVDSTTVAAGLRRLRNALRRLAADATEDPRPAVTVPALTRAQAVDNLNVLARAWPELVWPADEEPGQVVRADGTPNDLVVGLIAHQGVEIFAGAGRERLRACLAPNCLLFFFKQQTRREWCSPECGNRARVARHYQRHHASHQR